MWFTFFGASFNSRNEKNLWLSKWSKDSCQTVGLEVPLYLLLFSCSKSIAGQIIGLNSGHIASVMRNRQLCGAVAQVHELQKLLDFCKRLLIRMALLSESSQSHLLNLFGTKPYKSKTTVFDTSCNRICSLSLNAIIWDNPLKSKTWLWNHFW